MRAETINLFRLTEDEEVFCIVVTHLFEGGLGELAEEKRNEVLFRTLTDIGFSSGDIAYFLSQEKLFKAIAYDIKLEKEVLLS